MTNYIQNDDGKMAGSIGAGRDKVPGAAPATATRPSEDTPSFDLTSLAALDREQYIKERIGDLDSVEDADRLLADAYTVRVTRVRGHIEEVEIDLGYTPVAVTVVAKQSPAGPLLEVLTYDGERQEVTQYEDRCNLGGQILAYGEDESFQDPSFVRMEDTVMDLHLSGATLHGYDDEKTTISWDTTSYHRHDLEDVTYPGTTERVFSDEDIAALGSNGEIIVPGSDDYDYDGDGPQAEVRESIFGQAKMSEPQKQESFLRMGEAMSKYLNELPTRVRNEEQWYGPR